MAPPADGPAPAPTGAAAPHGPAVAPDAAVAGGPRGAGAGPGSGHPAVDAALRSIVNAAGLSPADQIAQYEAAHRTLQETLATIDQT
jgi:hypothetical protein